jgi:hypothetical protein
MPSLTDHNRKEVCITSPAKQLDCAAGFERVQDTYFIDPMLALKTALENHQVLSPNGDLRTQICYYDGDPLDDAPLNLINVPSHSFANFFADNSLELPVIIVCSPDTNASVRTDIEVTFQQMIQDIEATRSEHILKWEGYPHHRDSYFLDARVAYQTALQQNRVFLQHPTKTGLQVC